MPIDVRRFFGMQSSRRRTLRPMAAHHPMKFNRRRWKPPPLAATLYVPDWLHHACTNVITADTTLYVDGLQLLAARQRRAVELAQPKSPGKAVYEPPFPNTEEKLAAASARRESYIKARVDAATRNAERAAAVEARLASTAQPPQLSSLSEAQQRRDATLSAKRDRAAELGRLRVEKVLARAAQQQSLSREAIDEELASAAARRQV